MSERLPSCRRRTVLVAVGSVAATGSVAGCTALESDGGDADENGDDHDEDGHDHDHDDHDASAVPDLEPARETLADETTAPDGGVTVGVGFAEASLPITTGVYEPASDAAVDDTERQDTAAIDDLSVAAQPPEELPVVETESLDLYHFTVEPGDARTLTFVVSGDAAAEFESEPPDTVPFDHGTGAQFDCYCTDDVYQVAEGGLWARVVEIAIDEGVDPGTTAVVGYPVDASET